MYLVQEQITSALFKSNPSMSRPYRCTVICATFTYYSEFFSLSLCCHASQSFLCFRSIPAQGDTNHVHCVTANLHLLLFHKLILVRRLQVLLTERVCVGALFVALQRRPLGVFLEQTHGLGVLYKMSVLFCQIKSAR
jgi:hypothetical protein